MPILKDCKCKDRYNLYLFSQSLNYNKDTKGNSSYNPPVNPYDMNFHRGKHDKKPGKNIKIIILSLLGNAGKT